MILTPSSRSSRALSVIAAEAETFTLLRRFANSSIVRSISSSLPPTAAAAAWRNPRSACKSQFADDLKGRHDLKHRDIHARRRSYGEGDSVDDVLRPKRLELPDETRALVLRDVRILENIGCHPPRRHLSHAHPGSVKIDAQLPRQRMNARLRRVIGDGRIERRRILAEGVMAGDGGDVDDMAAVSARHTRCDQPCEMQHRPQIDVDQRIDVIRYPPTPPPVDPRLAPQHEPRAPRRSDGGPSPPRSLRMRP